MTGERHCYDELEHDTAALLMTGEGDRGIAYLMHIMLCYFSEEFRPDFASVFNWRWQFVTF